MTGDCICCIEKKDKHNNSPIRLFKVALPVKVSFNDKSLLDSTSKHILRAPCCSRSESDLLFAKSGEL